MSRRPAYRGSKDTLTGGTKDVNPQFMNVTAKQSSNDGYQQVAFPVPVQRLARAGRAQVMEVLKIFWGMSEINNAPTGGFKLLVVTGSLTTRAMAAGPPLQEPTLFSQYVKAVTLNATGGACDPGQVYEYGAETEPFVQDLTDGQGHGVLIATDQIFLSIASFQTGIQNTATAKILYRWKDVSMTEYIGIVQGQQ